MLHRHITLPAMHGSSKQHGNLGAHLSNFSTYNGLIVVAYPISAAAACCQNVHARLRQLYSANAFHLRQPT